MGLTKQARMSCNGLGSSLWVCTAFNPCRIVVDCCIAMAVIRFVHVTWIGPPAAGNFRALGGAAGKLAMLFMNDECDAADHHHVHRV